MLTPDEVTSSRLRFLAVAKQIETATEPDADGKVRITKAELGQLTLQASGALIALLVDVVD